MCARSLRAPQPQRPARTARSGPAVQASAVEVFQLADEASLISGTAAVLFACTLVVSYFGCRCVPISPHTVLCNVVVTVQMNIGFTCELSMLCLAGASCWICTASC